MTVVDARTGARITVGTGVLHDGDPEASYELLDVRPTSLTRADVVVRSGTGMVHRFQGLPIRYFQFGFRSVVIPS